MPGTGVESILGPVGLMDNGFTGGSTDSAGNPAGPASEEGEGASDESESEEEEEAEEEATGTVDIYHTIINTAPINNFAAIEEPVTSGGDGGPTNDLTIDEVVTSGGTPIEEEEPVTGGAPGTTSEPETGDAPGTTNEPEDDDSTPTGQ